MWGHLYTTSLFLFLLPLSSFAQELRSRSLSSGGRNKKKDKERQDAIAKEEAALLQKARARLNTTSEPQWDGYYDFIFGWSTGHVGTTTLSEKRLYGSPDNVTFLHEMKYGKAGLPSVDDVYTTDRWRMGNYTDEYNYVKQRYIPWLLKNKYPKSRTVLDLGHNINYFYDALFSYLLNETQYKFAVVRLRRERLEAAQSLTYGHPTLVLSDVCADLITRFCPFDHAPSNLIQLPGPNSYGLWANFTNIQKALWIADETEARWQSIKRQYSGRFKYIELLWAKQWAGSIDFAALQVAGLFGMQRVWPWDPSWKHMEEHIHAGDAAVDPVALWQSYREDKDYQERMKFPYIPS